MACILGPFAVIVIAWMVYGPNNPRALGVGRRRWLYIFTSTWLLLGSMRPSRTAPDGDSTKLYRK